MLVVKPFFYDSFKCISDKCTDTCCSGWEIDIDDTCWEKYLNTGGTLGEKLRKNITEDDGCRSFILTENDSCPFLTEKGLCEIYSESGEAYLCEICREHPRFYCCFDFREERGLGLCCEEAVRLLFSSDKPIEFIKTEIGDSNERIYADSDAEYVAECRDKLFDILYDRKILLAERIKKLMYTASEMQEESMLYGFEVKEQRLEYIVRQIILAATLTEPINREWTDYIGFLVKNTDGIIYKAINESVAEEPYEQLLTYLLFRHFIDMTLDEDFETAVKFCIFCTAFVYIQDMFTLIQKNEYTFKDRINNVKLFSKQIEYSEENIRLIKSRAREIF